MIAKLLRLVKLERECKHLRPLNLDSLYSELSQWYEGKEVTLATKAANLFIDLEDERFRKIALSHTFWESNANRLCSREHERFLKLMEHIKNRYSPEEWKMRDWAFGRIEKA